MQALRLGCSREQRGRLSLVEVTAMCCSVWRRLGTARPDMFDAPTKVLQQDAFISFLELLRERTPAEQQLVVLLDNCSMHKSKKVAAYIFAANISVLWYVPYAP